MKRILQLSKRFRLCFLTFLLFSQIATAQLNIFTLQVTPTNETCLGNGSLSFSVSNVTAGASIVYSIFHLPNTTNAISIQSGTSIGGLVAGNYRVVATQSLGNLSNVQQQDVVIASQIIPLTYQLVGQNEVCGFDGTITVTATTGIAVGYEIISGPVIKTLQTSNVFTGLTGGIYTVRVFDSCGEGVVQTYTLFTSPTGLNVSVSTNLNVIDCNTALVSIILNSASTNVIAYPLTVQITVHPPTGPVEIYTQVITSGAAGSITISQNIVLHGSQSFSYDIQATDSCGHVQNTSVNVTNPPLLPLPVLYQQNCTTSSYYILNATAATIISAPTAFQFPLPYVLSIGSSTYIEANNLPVGIYIINAIDVCGIPRTISIEVTPGASVPLFLVKESACGTDPGSILITTSGGFQSVLVTAAPSTFPQTIPYNATANLDPTQHNFWLGPMPIGSYVFQTTDTCNNIVNLPVSIVAYTESTSMNLMPHCGSFDLEFNHTSNGSANPEFFLQKLNSITGNWGHPQTGVVYPAGTVPNSTNSLPIQNNTINYNLAFTGKFRIVKNASIFATGTYDQSCTTPIQEFEFLGVPKINDVYSFNCSSNLLNIIVDAVGVAPLQYKITTKNGLPFVINNGTSSVFSNLTTGSYNFQVTDSCNNVVNRLFVISAPYQFMLTATTTFCPGQTGSLSVPNFDFLTYQWWEDAHPTTILSTTNVLNFPNFNPATQSGNYHVTIIFPNGSACPNLILNHVINQSDYFPKAGADKTTALCGNNGILNLTTYLTLPYDPNGTWSELTSSGMLNGNMWNSSTVPAGIYTFKYRVTGLCNTFDEALITIQIYPNSSQLVLTPSGFCPGQNASLSVTNFSSLNYQWWESTHPTTILSTTNVLNFPNFNPTTQSGNYHVTIVFPNSANCSNITLNYVVNPNGFTPKAGVDKMTSYCGNNGILDLTTLLTSPFDLNGSWSELTSSGMLNGSSWNSTAVAPGIYLFKYRVNGLCNTFDEALISIRLYPIPNTPIASVTPIICDTQQIQLFASTVPNVTYVWSGPNGFTSSLQNPIINPVSSLFNGVYTVKTQSANCDSANATVSVLVHTLPDFTISNYCKETAYTVEVFPIGSSFDPNTAQYTWTGPDNFSSTDNPINLTNHTKGLYTLTITNTDGCSNSHDFDLKNNLCTIPKGVSPNDDTQNDDFDLTGISGIQKFEVFNRYGTKVYEHDGYLKQWHGQDSSGTILPSGTYYYFITLETGEAKTGWVYVSKN